MAERAQYLSLQQLAEHFGVSVSTARKLPIPFTRIGSQRRYPMVLIEKYARDRATQPRAWEGAA